MEKHLLTIKYNTQKEGYDPETKESLQSRPERKHNSMDTNWNQSSVS